MPKLWKRRPEVLLLPNIPKPLHGVNPRTVLGGSWWNRERHRSYASTNYHCEACGVHKTKAKPKQWLEGHEVYHTDYEKGKLTYLRSTPLCPLCHKYIHDGRMHWLLTTGQITPKHYASVIQHGERILTEAGLHRDSHREREYDLMVAEAAGKVCPWADWRLVIDGEEYPPKFPTYEEWLAHYAEVDKSRHRNHRPRSLARFQTFRSNHLQRRRGN